MKVRILIACFVSIFAFYGAWLYWGRDVPGLTQGVLVELRERQQELDRLIQEYHQNNLQEIRAILDLPEMTSIYDLNQNQGAIRFREDYFGALGKRLPGFLGLRILNENGQRILYSSYPRDASSRDNRQIIYHQWEASPHYSGLFIPQSGETSGEYNYDAEAGAIYYFVPTFDQYDLYKGTAMVEFTVAGLQNWLFRYGGMLDRSQVQIVNERQLIFNISLPQLEAIRGELGSFLSTAGDQEFIQKIAENGDSFFLLQILGEKGERSLVVIRASDFLLPRKKQILLLVIVGLSSFFLSYFLLGLKGRSEEVVRKKIRKFQYTFIKDLIEMGEDLDWQRYELDLRTRKKELREAFLKGSGKLQERELKDIEAFLDLVWEEILQFLFTKQGLPRFSLEEFEQMFRRLLQENFPSTPQEQVSGGTMEAGESEDLEELEEFEEPEEGDSSLEVLVEEVFEEGPELIELAEEEGEEPSLEGEHAVQQKELGSVSLSQGQEEANEREEPLGNVSGHFEDPSPQEKERREWLKHHPLPGNWFNGRENEVIRGVIGHTNTEDLAQGLEKRYNEDNGRAFPHSDVGAPQKEKQPPKKADDTEEIQTVELTWVDPSSHSMGKEGVDTKAGLSDQIEELTSLETEDPMES